MPPERPGGRAADPVRWLGGPIAAVPAETVALASMPSGVILRTSGGMTMTVSSNVSDTLLGVAQHDAGALEGLFQARLDNLDASGLDPKSYSLANIAALIASEAAPASYAFQVGMALDAGVTPEEILGLLVALNPTVGNVRIVSAAAEIAFALGIDLGAES